MTSNFRSIFRSFLRRPTTIGQFVTLQEIEDHGALFLDGEFHLGEGGPGRQRRVESAGERLDRLSLGVLEDNGGGLLLMPFWTVALSTMYS